MKSDLTNKQVLFFLSKIKGLGSNTIFKLIKANNGNFNIPNYTLDNIPTLNNRIRNLIFQAWNDKEFVNKVNNQFNQLTEPYITILDTEYPDRLKNIYDPPLFLFYRGNIKLLKSDYLLTIVGSRTLTDYHQNSTKQIIKELAQTKLVITSGLAKGIDSISHQTALNNQLLTIAVLGSSVAPHLIYPQNNVQLAKDIVAHNGLLVSEYSAHDRTEAHNFAKRDRILAGLSKVTIIISGAKKSGSLITAQVALDEGREIYALPGNIDTELSYAPNYLIEQGANILINPNNILEKYL